MRDIEVIFVDEPDATINPLGVKGLGEIGIGRELPITLDKLQMG